MTDIYFIRHAEPNYRNHDDRSRELTAKGLCDRKTLIAFFRDKPVDAVLSSPYRRAYDTVLPLAEERGLTIKTNEAFRERRVDSVWIDDFNAFARAQWADFDYKLTDGECLREVQERNAAALFEVTDRYPNQSVVIGSHGTAIAALLNYFDSSFGDDDFRRLQPLMPLIVHFSFDGRSLCGVRMTDPLKL